MTIASPEVKKLIAEWQDELRRLTDDQSILLVTYDLPRQPVEFGRVREVVCDATGIPFDWVKGKNRNKETALTRHMIAYYASKCTILTQEAIASKLGLRKHTSIIRAKKRIDDLLSTGDVWACVIAERICKRLAGSPLPA